MNAPRRTITSSSAAARRAACSRIALPAMRATVCCCSKPDPKIARRGSTCRSATARRCSTRCTTGVSTPIPTRGWTAGGSRRCEAASVSRLHVQRVPAAAVVSRPCASRVARSVGRAVDAAVLSVDGASALSLRSARRRVRVYAHRGCRLPRRHRARRAGHRRSASQGTPATPVPLRAPRSARERCRARDASVATRRRLFRKRCGTHRGRRPAGTGTTAAQLAPAHRSPCHDCRNGMPSTCSTKPANRVLAAVARSS